MADLLNRAASPVGDPRLHSPGDHDLGRLARRSAAAYEDIAAEYYVREWHPTCANFDAVQDALLPELRPLAERTDGVWLEVGCGRGRLDRLVAPKQVILSDISSSMLALARQRTENRVSCRLLDALELPLEDCSLQGVVAFLADPYNHSVFFSHVRRVLRKGGYLSFTLPNHEWASAVRTGLGQPLEETYFIHRDRRVRRVPSLTRGIDNQCKLLQAIGFRVILAYSVSLIKCPNVVPSHHVALAARRLGGNPRHLPILDVYVASKND